MSIYKSTTLGPIPLSFTGRHLMQNLREAMTDYASKLANSLTKTAAGHVVVSPSWEPVSLARGRIAQHMSKLEARNGFSDEHGYSPRPSRLEDLIGQPFKVEVKPDITKLTTDELIAELNKRLPKVATPLQTMPPSHMNCRSTLVPIVEFGKVKRPKRKAKKSTRKHK